MNKHEKGVFVRELIANVERDILEKLDKIPENWDGIELRRYIADKFEESTIILRRGRVREGGYTKRLKAYNNDVIVNNL